MFDALSARGFSSALLVAAALCASSLCTTTATAQDLYDTQAYRTVHLTFTQSDWWSQLQRNRSRKTDLRADLRIGNTTYKDVGVRFRGSSSYAATGSSRKKSFNITTDAFVPGQDIMGYDSLNLSNGFNDPTFTREVVSYEILRRYMPAPKANYIKLVINNESWGVYINVQQPDKGMMREWFRDDDGNRYRCDPPTRAGSGRSAMQWLGSNLQDYKNAYELKTSVNATSFVDVMNLCNVLNNTSASQLPQKLPVELNVDRALWYLALNSILVNLDSYIGRGNDYYLFHDDYHGTMEILPWDMNESFGGYNAGMSVSQLKRVSPFWQATNTRSRPLMAHVLANSDWRDRYIAHYRTLLDREFDWKKIGARMIELQSIIEKDVTADSKRLYPLSLFKGGLKQDARLNSWIFRTWVPGLEPFVTDRRNNLLQVPEMKRANPVIDQLRVSPSTPRATERAFVTARVRATGSLRDVHVYWRVRGPFQRIAMLDDGKNGDGKANDGVYGAAIGPYASGTRVEYYVSAGIVGGGVRFEPRTAAHRAPSYRVAWPRRSSTVVLNEFVASNRTGVVDEKQQHEDWVELVNASSSTVDVGGMYLTDDWTKPKKWRLPTGTTIAADKSLLIWIDDDPTDGPLHATFKLDANGEEIALFDKDGATLLDSIEFGRQITDRSTGRLYDAKGPWVTFSKPTARMRNEPTQCGTRDYDSAIAFRHRATQRVVGKPATKAQIHIDLAGARPGGAYAEVFATRGGRIGLPGTALELLFDGPVAAIVVVPASANGTARLPLTVPDDASLVGRRLYLQALTIDTRGLNASNATEITFCKG